MNTKYDQYDLDNIIINITNYLIDNEIIINDDDDTNIKCKKFLLKYKRIISIFCLIILLIIGYYCNPYNIHGNVSSNNQLQNGGSVDPIAQAKADVKAKAAKVKTDASKAKSDAKDAATKAKATAASPEGKAAAIKAKGEAKATAAKEKSDAKKAAPSKLEKSAARGDLKMDKHKQALKDIGNKATTLSTYTSPLTSAGRAVADNADLIFQIFYSIAIFILICIVTLPAIAFIVVGLLCYVLLKPKMEALKEL